MRLSLVSLSMFALVLTSDRAVAQSTRQLEVSGLAGAAHTARPGRLGAEEWLEPYAGLRVDARLWSVGGGRAGVALMYDYYEFSVQSRGLPPCVGVCALSGVPGADGLVEYHEKGADERLAVGATWQRPLVSWLRVDVTGVIGVRQATHGRRVDEQQFEDSAPRRALLAGEVGVSTQWRAFVAGLGFQYGGSAEGSSLRRVQNRVAFRLGYALRLDAPRR